MHLIDLTTKHLPSETERLVATAERLGDLGVRAPSLCAGWTRGHVLTHLARNAEALSRVCAAVLTGEPDTMYDSVEARDADIEAGAAHGLRPSSPRTCGRRRRRLAPQISRLGVEHVGTTVERVPGGQLISAERVPFMRLREVVWHHVDLDAGYGFEETPDELVHLFLDDLVDTSGLVGRRSRTRGPDRRGRRVDHRGRRRDHRRSALGRAALAGPGSPRRAQGAGSLAPPPAVRRVSHVRHLHRTSHCRAGPWTCGNCRGVTIRKLAVSQMANNAYLLTCRATGASCSSTRPTTPRASSSSCGTAVTGSTSS